MSLLRSSALPACCAAALAASYLLTLVVENDYVFFAGYTILQFVALGSAWNLLGGYGGYVNFGAAGFFAAGAYSALALHRLMAPPLPVLLAAGGLVAGLLGMVAGALTLRLRGMYFSIATLAIAVLLETAVTNWDFVGGGRGATLLPPASSPGFASYIKFLFVVMAAIAIGTLAVVRGVERSWFGRALFALRDGEEAAEACGVPTLGIKIAAAALSCGLMGVSGALLPFYLTFIEPQSAFGMNYSIYAVAIAMIGGVSSWVGPILGALLLGVAHQATTVLISSEIGVLVMGLTLITFVVAAPGGLVGLWRRWRGRASG